MTSSKSITYILSGSLLYTYNGLAGGWTSGLAAIFGFILFMIGLNMLKTGLDSEGRSGAGLMLAGAVVGGMASFFALAPLIGNLSGIGFIISFILIILGLIRLNKSASIGQIGKSGTSQVIAAMVIALFGAFVGMLPFVGNVIASLFALAAMLLKVTGWLKVQQGLTTSFIVE